MRLLTLLTFCTFLITGCSKEATLTPKSFTSEFADRLRQTCPDWKIIIEDDLQLRIENSDGEELHAFLENAFDTYKLDPSQKEFVLQNYVTSTVDNFSTGNEIASKSQIVPIVKDRGWLTETKQTVLESGVEEAPEHVMEELNEELVILYAQDTPTNILYLTPEGLEEVGIEQSELRSIAIDNLKSIISQVELIGDNGLYIVTAGGDYDASLLLFDSIWSSDQLAVKGEIVVAIPARDLLLVTGSEDSEGIQKVKDIVNESYSESPYRLTTKLFVYRNNKFVVWND